MNGLEPLIPMALFFSIAGVLILKGPIGKGIADRLSGRAVQGPDTGSEARELRHEVEELRYRLGEVEERIDFTERMLTRGTRVAGDEPTER